MNRISTGIPDNMDQEPDNGEFEFGAPTYYDFAGSDSEEENADGYFGTLRAICTCNALAPGTATCLIAVRVPSVHPTPPCHSRAQV